MKTEIYCVTGNAMKFNVVEGALKPYGLLLVQKKLELEEIQSNSVEEVAAATAKRAFAELKAPVITTDAGLSIEALRGFPGPFIKYINGWFTAQDYLRLMEGVENRNASFLEAIGCCKEGAEPKVFVRELPGVFARVAGRKSAYTSVNEVFVPEGFDVVSSEIDQEEIEEWARQTKDPNFWQGVADYFK